MGMLEQVWKALALRTSPKREPPGTAASSAAAIGYNDGRVGKANAHVYRGWSRGSEWVRSAINIRNNQIATAEWDIVPIDDTKRYSKRLQDEIRALFDTPNPDDRTFSKFSMRVNEDILVLDAGSVEKVRSLDGRLRQLWAVDGGEMRVNALWDGDPAEPRYYWYPAGAGEAYAAFRNDDFVYLTTNPNSYSVLGVSPLETLRYVIEAHLSGDDYNVRQLKAAAPDGMLDLGEGARPEQVRDFENYWRAEVAGKGAMAIVGGTKGSKFIPFRNNNRDMQFLEWQVFLVRKIAAVFGLSPQDLGLTMDINRANAEQQAEQTEDRGLRPLMAATQDYWTHEVVWDPSFGGRANNLCFRFMRLNLKETTQKAAINEKALSGTPWKTVDEARVDDGRPPLGPPFGDKLIMRTSTGVVLLDDIPTAREAMKLSGGGAELAMPEEL